MTCMRLNCPDCANAECTAGGCGARVKDTTWSAGGAEENEEDEELSETSRGTGGFGSTGTGVA